MERTSDEVSEAARSIDYALFEQRGRPHIFKPRRR